MKIIISGLGLMGGSLAMAIRRNFPGVTLGGHDLPDVLNEAVKKQVVDFAIDTWPDNCHDADLIFLAGPVSVIRDHLQKLNGVISKETIVTDLGSIKLEIVELVRKIDFSGTFVGGHPLAGAEKNGLGSANPLLFENAIYVLTPVDEKQVLPEKLVKLLEGIKSRVLNIQAGEHDRIVAYISHLPQLVSVALMNMVGNNSEVNALFLRMAAGGFRDLTRIASSPYGIWNDILNTNRVNIKQAIADFVRTMENVAERLPELHNDFDTANSYRRQLPRDHKGFINPLVDVVVMVRDQVGVVASISGALFKQNIDIRDIELLKLREGEGGIFRLSFQSMNDAQNAIIIMNKLGYQAQIRE